MEKTKYGNWKQQLQTKFLQYCQPLFVNINTNNSSSSFCNCNYNNIYIFCPSWKPINLNNSSPIKIPITNLCKQIIQKYSIFHYITRYLSKHFCLQLFSPKVPFFYCSRSSLSPWVSLMVGTKALQITWKCIFLGFFLEFQNLMGTFKENLTRNIHTTFLYACL